jgi:hypothetical protein
MAGSTLSITKAQADLPRLVKRDSFSISCHGEIMGVYLCRDRIEALIESMELLADPEFQAALADLKTGKGRRYEVAELDKAMSR